MKVGTFNKLNDSIPVLEAREWILATTLETYGSTDSKGREKLRKKFDKIAFPRELRGEEKFDSVEDIERLFGHG